MPSQLVPFLLVVIVLTVVPGPDLALGLRNSLRGGTRAMWWTGLGCCTGLLVHAAASIAGLSALLAASATAYTVVKTAGAAYLVWLGASTLWKSWRHRHDAPETGDTGMLRRERNQPDTRSPDLTVTRRAAFRQGLLSNLLNPKIVFLFLTLLPQFVSPGEPRIATSMQLTGVFVGVALVWWRLTSWLVGNLRELIARRRVRLVLERLTGGLMVALGLRVVLDGP